MKRDLKVFAKFSDSMVTNNVINVYEHIAIIFKSIGYFGKLWGPRNALDCKVQITPSLGQTNTLYTVFSIAGLNLEL